MMVLPEPQQNIGERKSDVLRCGDYTINQESIENQEEGEEGSPTKGITLGGRGKPKIFRRPKLAVKEIIRRRKGRRENHSPKQ